MNDLQTIFTVTYSIIYGIMLDSIGGLNLFHFGWLFRNDYDKDDQQKSAFKRIFVSISLINVLPILFFAFFYVGLDNSSYDLIKDKFFLKNIYVIISIFMFSQIIFSFYRMIHVLMKYRLIFDAELYKETDDNVEKNTALKKKGLDDFRRYKKLGPSSSGQIFACLFYLVPPIIGLQYLINLNYFFLFSIVGILGILGIHKIGEHICENQRKNLYLFFLFVLFLYVIYLILFPFINKF